MVKFIKERIGIPFLLLLLFILAVTGFLCVKHMPVSFAKLTVTSDEILPGEKAILTVDGEKIESESTDGSVIFDITEEFYEAQKVNLRIDGMKEAGKLRLSFSSRSKELCQTVLSEKAGKTEDGAYVCSFDSSVTDVWNQAFSKDPFLKTEILIPLWIAGGIILLLLLVFKNLRKFFFPVLGLVIYALFALSVINNIPETTEYVELSTDINDLSAALTPENTVEQTFTAQDNTFGLGVKMAVYDQVPQNKYLMEIVEKKSGKVVVTREIKGSSINGNNYTYFEWDEALEDGKEYIARFRCEEETPDPVTLWISGTDTYEGGTLIENGEEKEADAAISLITSGPDIYPIVITFLAVIFVLLLLTCFSKVKTARIVLIYAGVFLLFSLRAKYYYETTFLGAYDEEAHVSYLAYLEDEGKLIPEYEDMKLLAGYNYEVKEDQTVLDGLYQTSGIYDAKWTETVNYLCHPPLYYWLLTLFHPISIRGDHVYADMTLLRELNLSLAAITILLFFYIGFTRIKKEPVLHLVFAVLVTGVPMFGMSCLTVNNDNLTLLTVAVFFLAGLRYVEKNRNFVTYLLLALGISATLLTKVTAGLIVCVTALAYVVYDCIREKNLRAVINFKMLGTLPIYGIAVFYYVKMLITYHTVQPSLAGIVSSDVFKTYSVIYVDPSNRTLKNFWDFASSFLKQFLNQWKNGVFSDLTTKGHTMWLAGLGITLMWLIPLISFVRMGKGDDQKRFLGFFSGSVLLTVLIQFIRAFRYDQFISGHPGRQSRYYLCVVIVFAFIFVKWLEKQFYSQEKPLLTIPSGEGTISVEWQKVCHILLSAYAVWILYGSFLVYLVVKIKY